VLTAVFGDALYDPATAETVRDAVVIIEDGRIVPEASAGARWEN